MTRTAYHHHDLRNALVDEALALLADGGIATLTLRELARRIGVTHAAPYAHFSDKAALLEAVAEVGFRRLHAALVEAKARHGSADDAFVAMGDAYVRFASANPDLYRLMFVGPGPGKDASPDEGLHAAGLLAFDVLARTIAEITGARDDASLGDDALGAWATVHGLAMLALDERTGLKSSSSPEALVRHAATTYARGLRSRSGHPPA